MKYLGPISDDKDLVNKEYVDNHSGGGEHVELTQAEYDLLTPEEKSNGSVYFITDTDPEVPAVNDSVPIGAIQAYGGLTSPYGWLICDGSAISRTAFSELFDVIGTTYGAGDGSTTFNIPDLKGRVIVGVGESSATGHTVHALGQSDGEETHVLTVNELAKHWHGIEYKDPNSTAEYYKDTLSTDGWASTWRAIGENGTGPILSNGNDQPHNNMQPYLVTNYIIKAKEPTLVTATVPPVITDFIDIFYPVGSYYESSDASFDPNASWGGTWVSETITDDVIVEEGTSGIWTYRKWASGVAECWGVHNTTVTGWSGWGNVYEGTPFFYISYPTSFFTASPNVQLTVQTNTSGTIGIEHMNDGSKDRTGYSWVLRPSTGPTNYTYPIGCYAKGLWKTYTAPNTKYKWHRTA